MLRTADASESDMSTAVPRKEIKAGDSAMRNHHESGKLNLIIRFYTGAITSWITGNIGFEILTRKKSTALEPFS
jgi:hypothetical protein